MRILADQEKLKKTKFVETNLQDQKVSSDKSSKQVD